MWEQLDAAVGEERAEQCWPLCSYLCVWLQFQPALTPAPTEAMKTWPYLAVEYFSCCLTSIWLPFLFLKRASAFLVIHQGKVSVSWFHSVGDEGLFCMGARLWGGMRDLSGLGIWDHVALRFCLHTQQEDWFPAAFRLSVLCACFL